MNALKGEFRGFWFWVTSGFGVGLNLCGFGFGWFVCLCWYFGFVGFVVLGALPCLKLLGFRVLFRLSFLRV